MKRTTYCATHRYTSFGATKTCCPIMAAVEAVQAMCRELLETPSSEFAVHPHDTWRLITRGTVRQDGRIRVLAIEGCTQCPETRTRVLIDVAEADR